MIHLLTLAYLIVGEVWFTYIIIINDWPFISKLLAWMLINLAIPILPAIKRTWTQFREEIKDE